VAPALGSDQTLSLKELSDRTRRWPVLSWLSLNQSVTNGLGTVLRILPPDGKDAFRNLWSDAATVSLGRVRSIVQCFDTPLSEALKVLVTGLLAYSELAADISDPSLSIGASLDKCQLL
jgi:hypothetical protein